MKSQAFDNTSKEINILDLVMTTNEASKIYNVADSTLRSWIKEGLFRPQDIKKSGTKWIMKKEALEEILRKKNMLGKTFVLDGEEVYVEHLGYKGKNIQIWYENDNVKEIIEEMPHKELIPQMFDVFKEETNMNFKFVLIENDLEHNDNWFFRKEKVWTLTLNAVIDTVRKSMVEKGFDTSKLDAYLEERKISVSQKGA